MPDEKLRTLILTPTRELAIQVFEYLSLIVNKMTDKKVNPNQENGSANQRIEIGFFVGGIEIEDDRNIIKNNNVNIAIGTLGRIKHLLKENTLNLANLQTLVLDEAD